MSSFPSTFGSDGLAVPDERAALRDLEVRDIRVSDTVTGMMIAAVSGAVVGFLTAGGVACAALVFVASWRRLSAPMRVGRREAKTNGGHHRIC